MNDKLRKGWPNLLMSAIICGIGIAAVWHLEKTAMQACINGVSLATAIGVILAIVLAFTGVKLKDVFLK